ncbi:MAG: hypothetical protein JW808_04265, partial [Victivallales bacterium]|nr:hypothetical protein [Victivallales bacterium]
IFLGVILFYGRLICGHMPSTGDALTYQLPEKVFTRWCLLDGTVPAMNPYILSGSPHLSNIATGTLYPLNLFLLAGNEVFGHNLFLFVHVALAGCAMFILVRRVFGFSHAISSICAVSYCLGGCVWGTVDKGFLVSAWLIPTFFACFCCFIRCRKVASLIGAVISLSLLFYSGNLLETCSVIVIALSGVVLYHLAGKEKREYKKRVLAAMTGMGLLLLIVANAALLSSPQLVPTYLASRISCRSGVVGLETARHWSFPAPRLIEYVLPFAFGNRNDNGLYYGKMYQRDSQGAGDSPWFDSVFIGLPMLLAALLPLAVCMRGSAKNLNGCKNSNIPEGQRDKMLFLYAGIVFFLLLSMGRSFPLYSLLYRFLPGFSFFRHPEKFLTWVNILLIIAGAHGLNMIESDDREFRRTYARTARCLIATLCIALLGIGFVLLVSPGDFSDFFSSLGSDWSADRVFMWQAGTIVSSISFLVIIVAVVKGFENSPKKIIACLAAVSLVQLISWSYLIQWTVPVSSFVNAISWEDELPEFDRSQWRIFAARNFHYQSAGKKMASFTSLHDNSPVLRKIRAPNGFSALMQQSYYHFFNFTNEDPMELLNKTSVRYIGGPPPARMQIPKGCKLLVNKPEFTILENMSAKPRISIIPDTATNENCEVRIINDSPGLVKIEVVGGGTLILRDWLSPGWQCFDNHNNQLVLTHADGGFISTKIPCSNTPRIVTFKFQTPGFNTGIILASAGAAILALISFRSQFQNSA